MAIKRGGGGGKGLAIKEKRFLMICYFSPKIGGRKKLSKSVSGYFMSEKKSTAIKLGYVY